MRTLSISPTPVNNSFRLGVDPIRCKYQNTAFKSKRFRSSEEHCLKFVNRNAEKDKAFLKRNVCTHCSSGEDLGERIIVGDSDHPEESVKLVCDESGCAVVIGKKVKFEDSDIESDYESDIESDGEFGADVNRPYYLSCDLRGCSLSPAAPVNGIEEIEGTNWFLKYELAPQSENSICAQVASNGWSVALTTSEYDNFCKLILSIRDEIINIDEGSIEVNENVNIELSRGSMKMKSSFPVQELSKLKNIFKSKNEKKFGEVSLSTVFTVMEANQRSNRQLQGFWPSEAFCSMILKSNDQSSEEKVFTSKNEEKVLQEETV